MDIPRLEMSMKSIAWSLGHVPKSVFRNYEERDFSGNVEDIPLMTAPSRTDLNINHNWND